MKHKHERNVTASPRPSGMTRARRSRVISAVIVAFTCSLLTVSSGKAQLPQRRVNAPTPLERPVQAQRQTTPAPLAVPPIRGTMLFRPGQDAPRDCSACPQLVYIPGGSFTMGSAEAGRGSEGPQHTVSIRPFLAGKFEVTFDEWASCASSGGCNGYAPADQGWGGGSRPVINVSWDDAKAYVSWLSRTAGKPYRLLSESEWEYAARAGSASAYWWGESISLDQANYFSWANSDGSSGRAIGKTQGVGSYGANAWGLFDVHGNVEEWVEDCYEYSYVGAPLDGSARISGDCSLRISRGGSWQSSSTKLRSSGRSDIVHTVRREVIGFRVARAL